MFLSCGVFCASPFKSPRQITYICDARRKVINSHLLAGCLLLLLLQREGPGARARDKRTRADTLLVFACYSYSHHQQPRDMSTSRGLKTLFFLLLFSFIFSFIFFRCYSASFRLFLGGGAAALQTCRRWNKSQKKKKDHAFSEPPAVAVATSISSKRISEIKSNPNPKVEVCTIMIRDCACDLFIYICGYRGGCFVGRPNKHSSTTGNQLLNDILHGY